MRLSVIRIIAFLVISLSLIAGCSFLNSEISSDLQASFENMISISNMNEDLKVKVMEVEKHTFGTDIVIIVENRGKNPVYFSVEPKTLYIKVFGIQEDQWVEIPNQVDYLNTTGDQGFSLMPQNSDQLNLFTTFVRPVFETNSNTEVEERIVRILVVGEMVENNLKTSVPVGAYVDYAFGP